MNRPRCFVFIATSLDGYIARVDGAIDWLSIVQREGEDYGYQSFFDSIDALVIGRKTYDTVRGFDPWPYKNKRCIVLTHRPCEPLQSEEFFVGSPQELLEQLGREGVQRVYVDGGVVIQQFLAAKLIDELTLSLIPIVLGSGLRLFADTELRLDLNNVRSWPTGLVQLRYMVNTKTPTPPQTDIDRSG